MRIGDRIRNTARVRRWALAEVLRVGWQRAKQRWGLWGSPGVDAIQQRLLYRFRNRSRRPQRFNGTWPRCVWINRRPSTRAVFQRKRLLEVVRVLPTEVPRPFLPRLLRYAHALGLLHEPVVVRVRLILPGRLERFRAPRCCVLGLSAVVSFGVRQGVGVVRKAGLVR